jgi:type I restriction enzyme S subunit
MATQNTKATKTTIGGGAVMAGINVGMLKSIKVLCPPSPLQQKFVALVQRHEHLRSIQRESLRQANHLFQTLLHEAFSPQLN